MSADLSKVVGFTLPDRPVSWTTRDLLLYAAGVGAKKDELHLTYELGESYLVFNKIPLLNDQDKNFTPMPTYPVVLPSKGDSQEINLFSERIKGKAIPSMPRLDPNRLVHGSQSIQILKDIPLASGPGWLWKSKYTGVSENKSGIVVSVENTLVSPTGEVYTKLYSSSFHIGAKATGGKFHQSTGGPPNAKPIPKRSPDYTVTDTTSPEQALVFRLSGDYNPLHIDPSIGERLGFGGIILHGLSTFGFAARAIIKSVGANDPRSLKFFGVRFTSPVKPGDKLETQAWEVGPGPDGTTEVTFITKNLTSEKVCIGSGIAYVRKPSQAKM